MAVFTIVNPYTGAPLLAHASLSGCYMAIGSQVIKWDFTRAEPQHTGGLGEAYVDEMISYCFGLHLLTNAERGQIYSAECFGTGQGVVSKITS